MATANTFFGTGGIDASLQFELGGDNIGAAFLTTLTTFIPFFTSRSSMSDIIAMGVYTAVRSCGGPAVPIRTGRIDATSAGPPGVPLPQNSLYTFEQQFLRTGFNTTEMIQVVACGHTIGGVHAVNFPQIVLPGSAPPNDYKLLDTTTQFDSKIASEFVAGDPIDPLSVGPSVGSGMNSDARVFGADGNVTITQLADPATFASVCTAMLQKMIEVVPSGVALTDPIVPYDIKPDALQLTALAGGSQLLFTGGIRVRTTVRPASQIASVQIVYIDRSGNSNAGTISTTQVGNAAGFDDSYTFYGFSASLPSSTSISAFNVFITLTGGATELHDNNGNGFPVHDTIMLQSSQSCMTLTGSLTVVAAVRNTVTAPSVNLILTSKTSQSGSPVPALRTSTIAMSQGEVLGLYTLYSATTALASNQTQDTKFDVSIGSVADTFKSTGDLSSTCGILGPGGSSSSATTLSTSTLPTTSIVPINSTTSANPTTSTTSTTTASSTALPSESGYLYQGCYTDSLSARVLNGKHTSDSGMSYSSCATFCSLYAYFGVEFGDQCYCGTGFSNPTSLAPESDCSVACTGNAAEVCGASKRLNVFRSTNAASTAPSNITVPGYTYAGCYTDSVGARVLSNASLSGSAMTLEKCAAFCEGYLYWGTEYGQQCYCGSALAETTTQKLEGYCGYVCAGNGTEICGGGSLLSLYQRSS
ncbi:hypothetical protein MMC13_000955 [Lambiella insularis]|nr:hypothetical protein [Lambiella insularis]